MQGWSKKEIRMATPDEVVEITGCEVGSVPPFGHKAVLPLLVDRGVYENTESTFNIGLRTNSVRVPTQEMKILFTELGVREGDFVKEDM
jgi:Ala-tRNA(Pro) deacylase